MARKIVKAGVNVASDEEVELNSGALENEENNEENNDNEIVEGEEGEGSDNEVEGATQEENTPAKSALEKVRLNNDLSCNIGGVFHRFKAGTEYFVEANVKSILRKSGYLEAL